MKTKITTFVLLLSMSFMAFANQDEKKQNEFKGKPIITIFSDYKFGGLDAKDVSGFNLERACLGYGFNFAYNLSAKVVVDFTNINNSGIERVGYVRNALVSWHTNDKRLKVSAGLIGLNQFGVSEKFWGYRYVAKSFQDEFKFGSSVDLGIHANYKINSWLSADLTITNGEGYKKLNKDNDYRYALGFTANPIKQITLRAYGDIYTEKDKPSQKVLAFFAGYKHQHFAIGAEYNKMWATKFQKDDSQEGFSLFARGFINNKWEVFARCDRLFVEENNMRENTTHYIVGADFNPVKYFSISPNILYVAKGVSNSAELYARINLQIKL